MKRVLVLIGFLCFSLPAFSYQMPEFTTSEEPEVLLASGCETYEEDCTRDNDDDDDSRQSDQDRDDVDFSSYQE